ncbi:MAG TPA: mandelate racemase/muconate lactonizing enzyme family protein [bacterium]|jgi:L-alanine-DL-glutamate epimerase-like enolase superfamily enzyme
MAASNRAKPGDTIIKDVRTQLISLPFVDPPKTGLDIRVNRTFVVAEIETAGGVVGMGYIQPLAGSLRSIDTCVHELFKPMLVGQDVTHVEKLWQTMFRRSYVQGRMGLSIMALSLLDIALWDAHGKHAGLPLYKLWGAHAEELPIYGSGCFRGMGGDGMIEKARRYVSQGFKAIKMQVAHVYTVHQDATNVRRMREALGEDIDIMIDVNQGWTADVAIPMARKFEAYDIYWLEEPVVAHDFAGYRRIAKATSLRIVGGENHFGRYDLRPFFEDPCVPILQPDVMRGGLTELRKIAAVADTWGIRIAPHLYHELMAHLVASIPNGDWLEYMGWHDDLWVHPLEPVEGRVRVPDRPGHGLAFKPEVLQDHPYKG